MNKDTIESKTYNLTPKEREIIEWRAQRRLQLRNEYLREMHNPNSKIHGAIFDSQVQRHYTSLFSYEQIAKPKVKSFLWFAGITLGSWSALYFWIKAARDEIEYRYRTGQVSYRDRDGKFV